jgi:hypothetical protein
MLEIMIDDPIQAMIRSELHFTNHLTAFKQVLSTGEAKATHFIDGNDV